MSSFVVISILISVAIIALSLSSSLSKRAALSQNQIAKNRRQMLDPPKAYIIPLMMMCSVVAFIVMGHWMAGMAADQASSGGENEAVWELPMQLWRIGTGCTIPVGIILGIALSRYQIALLEKHGPDIFEMAPHKILSASFPGRQGKIAEYAVLFVHFVPGIVLMLGLLFNAFSPSTAGPVDVNDEEAIDALMNTTDIAYSSLALELFQIYLNSLVVLPMAICHFLSVRWYGTVGRARFGSAQIPQNTIQYTNADL